MPMSSSGWTRRPAFMFETPWCSPDLHREGRSALNRMLSIGTCSSLNSNRSDQDWTAPLRSMVNIRYLRSSGNRILTVIARYGLGPGHTTSGDPSRLFRDPILRRKKYRIAPHKSTRQGYSFRAWPLRIVLPIVPKRYAGGRFRGSSSSNIKVSTSRFPYPGDWMRVARSTLFDASL